jgi:hypothetical protein
MGLVHNPNIDYSSISSMDVDKALEAFDNKGTCGWSEEITSYDYTAPDYTLSCSNPEGDLVWYNPYGEEAKLEEINFTIDELDELIDLLDDTKSKVMEF